MLKISKDKRGGGEGEGEREMVNWLRRLYVNIKAYLK